MIDFDDTHRLAPLWVYSEKTRQELFARGELLAFTLAPRFRGVKHVYVKFHPKLREKKIISDGNPLLNNPPPFSDILKMGGLGRGVPPYSTRRVEEFISMSEI
jgi:hypothetical protein